MNAAHKLEEKFRKRFPDLHVVITPPVLDNGVWHLDLRSGPRQWIVVEVYAEPERFGVSDISDNKNVHYGSGPDKTYPTPEETIEAVGVLLTPTT